MTISHINSKDLNLLKVFELILAECSLTRAAARLGLTQPALSRSLARLREEFDDPLFVRAPGGVLPTPKALALERPLKEALERIETLYAPAATFSPANASGVVRVATTDYLEQIIWIDLVGKLTRVAPKLTLVTQVTGSDLPVAALRSGDVQVAIAGYFSDLPAGLMRRTLLTDHFVSIVRQDHPLVGKKLTLETYLQLGHLIVSPRGNLGGAVDVALRTLGRERHVAASVSTFLSSGILVASSDLVLTTPARLVERFQRQNLPIVVFEPPIKLPPINVVQVWHERFQDDPMHAWLRSTIQGEVR